MSRLAIILFSILPLPIIAQDISGIWTGSLVQSNKEFYFEININKISKSGRVSGTTYIRDDGKGIYGDIGNFATMGITGRLRGNTLFFEESSILNEERNTNSWYWCIKQGKLVLNENESSLIFSGEWTSQGCPPGTIYVEMPKTSLEEGLKTEAGKEIETEGLVEYEINTKTKLNKVLFKQSTAELLPESYQELTGLYGFLDSHPKIRIRIEGHTDKIGDSHKNLILSQERAETIKEYLVEKGIEEERITTQGFGDTITLCSPPCIRNRRVEFILLEN